jgi:hypothetical protein
LPSGAPQAILEIGWHLDADKSHPTGDYRQGAVLIKWRPDGDLDR